MDRVKQEQIFWDEFASQDNVEELIADTEVEDALDIFGFSHLDIKPKHVVELGCGVGRILIPFAKANPKVSFTGIDISKKMIAKAKKKAKTEKVKNVELLANDGREILLDKVNYVYSFTVFQHIDAEGVQTYFKEVAKALAVGGVFKFQYVEGSENSAFSQQYKREQIEDWLMEAGFSKGDFQESVINPNWNVITAWI
jgi:cyclopropane fatty-acyl-phospholipid synthase-like methyltransferase